MARGPAARPSGRVQPASPLLDTGRRPSTPRPDSQRLQTVQALEAVGPQTLDAVVMKVPVWEEETHQTGRPQPWAGAGGADGGSSRKVEAEAQTDDPSARPSVSSDKMIGRARLRESRSPRLGWPRAAQF